MATTGKGPLRVALEDFLDTFGFGKKITGAVNAWIEALETEAIDEYDALVTWMGLKDNLPTNMQPDALRALIHHPVALIAAILPLLWSVIQKFTDLFIGPFMRPLGYLAEGIAHTRHPDAPDLARMEQRLPGLADKLHSLMATTGYDQISIDGYRELVKQLLGPLDYERLGLREVMTLDDVHAKLAASGFGPEDIDGLDNLVKLIPSPNDLISMAVREAFNDATSQQFGYDTDFDQIPEFVEFMKKQGFSEDWAKRYWRAHWQLPGLNSVYEMFHRLRSGPNQVTLDDVRLFLKTADISPFWRDRLIDISYSPYARVDIRRMWKLHILSEDEVYQAHRDIGYDDEKARKLTQFVVADQTTDKSDLTRSTVIQAYKRGVVSRDDAASSMQSIGLNSTDAEFYLQLADYDIEADKTDAQLQVIQARFVNGIIDETGLAAEMGRLNLPSDRTTILQSLWSIQRENKVNVPSRSELDDLLRRSIIQHDEYKKQLARDGYEPSVVNEFVTRVDQIIADDAAAELAAQQTEQQRLATATLRTSYQVNKADNSVQIAQLKSAIADIQLATHTITDPEQLITLTQQINEYKNLIVHLQENAANLYADYLKSQQTGGSPNA